MIRTGAGISVDPNTFRYLRDDYPATISTQYTGANAYQAAGTLRTGIPSVVGPDLNQTSFTLPAAVGTTTFPQVFHRGYIESCNFTVQRDAGAGFNVRPPMSAAAPSARPRFRTSTPPVRAAVTRAAPCSRRSGASPTSSTSLPSTPPSTTACRRRSRAGSADRCSASPTRCRAPSATWTIPMADSPGTGSRCCNGTKLWPVSTARTTCSSTATTILPFGTRPEVCQERTGVEDRRRLADELDPEPHERHAVHRGHLRAPR